MLVLFRFAQNPTRTFETACGYCCKFRHKAKIGGRAEQVYGAACRSAAGQWQVIN